MTDLIFTDKAEYDAFEAKMATREGIPKAGTKPPRWSNDILVPGDTVEPSNPGAPGWTMRFTDPVQERSGTRFATSTKTGVVLDAGDITKEEKSKEELDKFGELPRVKPPIRGPYNEAPPAADTTPGIPRRR